MQYKKFFESIKNYFKDFIYEVKEKNSTINVAEESTWEIQIEEEVPEPEYYGHPIHHKDDTQVYVPQFGGSKTNSKWRSKTFGDQKRPLAEDEHYNLIKESLSLESIVAKNKLFKLHQIWSDAKVLNDILKPLRDMKISYTLDLTGGSVRDFILDNHEQIKDLDFMLSIENLSVGHKYVRKGTISDLNEVVVQHFTKEELESVNWSEEKTEEASTGFKQDPSQSLSHDPYKKKLVSLCLNRASKNYEYFSKEKRYVKIGLEENDYLSDSTKKDRLMAVYKMSEKDFKTTFPIDILLTDLNKPAFLEDFDFDICKASICFVNDNINKEFPEVAYKLIGRIVALDNFWADAKNKKITYNLDGRNKYEINRSFDDHLDRIMKKYPDYSVNFVGSTELSLEYINKKIFVKDLKKELNDEKVSEVMPKKKLKV